MRRTIFLTVLAAAIFLNNCTQSYLNKNAFYKKPPKKIGIIIGHDIYVRKGLSPEGAILQTSTLGIFSLAARSKLTAERIDFAEQINAKISDNVNKEILSKGYEAKILKIQQNEWHRYEHMRDRKEVYSDFIKEYLTEVDVKKFDAILIIEYTLEGKIKGFRQEGEKVEELSAENMKVTWVESKTFLYDTRTGQRLFYDYVVEDYGDSEDVTIPVALKNLAQFGPIPNFTE
jgi:hypothetical protein